jgi:hypothetical protein
MSENQLKGIALSVIITALIILFLFAAFPNGTQDFIERQKEKARQKQIEMYRQGKMVQ